MFCINLAVKSKVAPATLGKKSYLHTGFYDFNTQSYIVNLTVSFLFIFKARKFCPEKNGILAISRD
jgi:hypothetical protein